jgi:hypothetical protein
MAQSLPRKFFEQHLRPSYEEWLRDPANERLARIAVQAVNDMAAHVLHYWQHLDRSQVYDCGAEDETRYRDELVKRECPDFAWARDVAEAYKHVVLTRRPETRIVTRFDQTAVEGAVFEEDVFEKGIFDEGEIRVTRDDGTSRPLAEVMQNVIEMWERLLERWML